MRTRRSPAVLIGLCGCLLAACSASSSSSSPPTSASGTTAASGIGKIKHVVVIMQENRSFDTYFGTYPGADGIAMKDGQPVACLPNPAGGCNKAFHDPADVNGGGPHGQDAATADIDGGKMDGFLTSAVNGAKGCADPNNPACTNGGGSDVLGWKDAREIPNYWAYAQNFVLQDRMFEPNASWSLPEHLFMVSEWSALCSKAGDPASCVNALQSPANPNAAAGTAKPKPKAKAKGAPKGKAATTTSPT